MGVKQPGREADHAPESSAEVTKSGLQYPICFYGIVLNEL
jgi:hypothetical protein